jgi:hypothetical protein
MFCGKFMDPLGHESNMAGPQSILLSGGTNNKTENRFSPYPP